MNDRFKFRVWLEYAKLYYGLDSFYYDRLRNKYTFHFEDGHTKTIKEKDCVIEQCTGLKDKNGRLIYEGDIVVKIDVNGIGYPRTRICRVYWKEDWLGWVIETEYGDVYALADYGSDNYEVIGNIHENPDLVEA